MAAADINFGAQDHTAKITESYSLPFTVANLSTSFWLSIASSIIISTAAVITVVALYYHRSKSFSNDVSFTSSENVKDVYENNVFENRSCVDNGSIYDKLYVQTNPSDPFSDNYFDNNGSDTDEIKQPLVADMVDTHPWDMGDTDMAEESKKTKDDEDMNTIREDNMTANEQTIADLWSHLEKDYTIYVSSDSESGSASDNGDQIVSRASKVSRLLNSDSDSISVQYKCTDLETAKDVKTVCYESKCGTPEVSHHNNPVSTGLEKLAISYPERARSVSYKLERGSLRTEHKRSPLSRPKSAPTTRAEDDKILWDEMSKKSINFISKISSQDVSSSLKDDKSVTESQIKDYRSIKSGRSRSAWSEAGEPHSNGHILAVPGTSKSTNTTSDNLKSKISKNMSVGSCDAVSLEEIASRQDKEQMNNRNQLYTLSSCRSRPMTPVHVDSLLMLENRDEETIDPLMGEGLNQISRPFLQELLESMSMDSQTSDVSAEVMHPPDLRTNASLTFDRDDDNTLEISSQSKEPEDTVKKSGNLEAISTANQMDTDETANAFNSERIKSTDKIIMFKTLTLKKNTETETQVHFVENGITRDVHKSSKHSVPSGNIQTTRKRKKIPIHFNVTQPIFPKESALKLIDEGSKVVSKSPMLKKKRSEYPRPITAASNKTHPLGKQLQRQLTTFDENHPFVRAGTAPKSAVRHIELKEPKMLSKKDLVKKAAYKKLQQSYKCRVPRMYNIEKQEVYRKLAKVQAESSTVKSTSKSSPIRTKSSKRQQRSSPTRPGPSAKMKAEGNILLQNTITTHSEV